MTVIWGLDLHEMQWWKFKSSWMFNKEYHLRRTKMIVYQIAMIFCVVSESVGTAALTDYTKQQDFISHLNNHAIVYNDDFVGIASYNIFVGIVVATIFGSAFFFDLFWPERTESKAVRLAWKIAAVTVTVMCLGDALALTVIVATRKAYITGVDAGAATALLRQHSKPPLVYKQNGRAVASAVLLWIGFVGCVGSTYVLITSQLHDDKHGPKSKYGRSREGVAAESKTETLPPPTTNNNNNNASPTIREVDSIQHSAEPGVGV